MGYKAGEVLWREGVVLCLLLLQMGSPPPAPSSMSREPRLHWHLQCPAQERCWGTGSGGVDGGEVEQSFKGRGRGRGSGWGGEPQHAGV